MHEGCPRACWFLCLELARRVEELMTGVSTPRAMTSDSERASPLDLLGTCWLVLHDWPRTKGDVLTRMAASIASRMQPTPTPESAFDPRRLDRLPAPGTQSPETLLRLAECRGLLGPDQRKLLTARYLVGLSSHELASALHTSPERVRRRCQQARQQLPVSRADLFSLTMTPAHPLQPMDDEQVK
ncbi:sigma factor-like helix-turn-helix DNA-binding protein [Luteococcus sp. H138]|uniref:sigma factor-like helix-turn-helix DNA-binding protein n=1 Tax=unclassified Luteococcus TaxID=2639923 RepID=UPI00406CE6A5